MKKLGLLLLAALITFTADAKKTVVYHTSDTHGFYFAQENRETGELKGGFAALTSFIKKGPKHYLLLDSGDFSSGTIEAKRSKGLKSIQLMNAVGYHASTIGNHEFDFKDKLDEKTGKDPLETMLDNMNFPILAANFFKTDGKTHPVNVQPYKIFTVDGVKIAVIGLANVKPTYPTSHYTFSDPLTTLEQILPEVEKADPQAVLVIAHDGLVDDKHGIDSYLPEIHRKLAGRVHVVFGGHVHKLVNKTINGVLFVESGTALQQVSKVTITTDDTTGKFVSATDEIVPLDVKTWGQDKNILKLADSLREPGADDVVGYTSLVLSEKPNQAGVLDSPLDDWFADICYEYVEKNMARGNITQTFIERDSVQSVQGTLEQQIRSIGEQEHAIDVFVFNTGGSRTDLPKGKITMRDLIDLYPHDNEITRMPMSGKDLATIVKGGIVATLLGDVVQYKTFYTYSGLEVVVHSFGKPNESGQAVAKEVTIFVNGKPLQEDAIYQVVTVSYIAFGGSEGKPFAALVAKDLKTRVGQQGAFGILTDAIREGKLQNLTTLQQEKLQKTGRVRVDIR